MNTLPVSKGMLLSIFFFGIFYANIPTAEAESAVKNISISPALSNEFNVVSFSVKPTAAGSDCVLWAVAVRIDDAYVPVTTILTPSFTTPTSHAVFNALFQPAIQPFFSTPVSIRLDEYITPGGHTLALVFLGSFCTSSLGPNIQYFYTNPIPFTVTPPPPPPVNGVCASPKIHYACAVGDPDSESVIPIPPDGGMYSWRCLGSNGGSDAWCNEFVLPLLPRDGVCSPVHYDCRTGSPINLDHTGNTYTWQCVGENGGKTASCEEISRAVDGMCSPVHYDCVSGDKGALFQSMSEYTWKCRGQFGGLTANCFEKKFLVPPTLDLKIDDQESLGDVTRGSSHTLTWTSANATTCTASSTDGSWTGMKSISNALGENVVVNNDVIYDLECANNRGSRQDSVPVTLKPILSLCTEGGVTPFVKAGDPPAPRSLYPNMSERLRAFYDTDPTDCAGTEVTTAWAQDSANPAVSISGNNTTPQVITAGPTAGLAEDVTLNQGTDTITLHYIIQSLPCVPDCSDAPNVCGGTVFSASNCGTDNCTGTKSCDYNFKETSP